MERGEGGCEGPLVGVYHPLCWGLAVRELMSVICLGSSPQRCTTGGSITHYKVKNSSTDFILEKIMVYLIMPCGLMSFLWKSALSVLWYIDLIILSGCIYITQQLTPLMRGSLCWDWPGWARKECPGLPLVAVLFRPCLQGQPAFRCETWKLVLAWICIKERADLFLSSVNWGHVFRKVLADGAPSREIPEAQKRAGFRWCSRNLALLRKRW